MRFRILAIGSSLLVALAMSACGLPADKAASAVPGNYVGKVDGTNAFISLVVGKEYAVAYLCDSDKIVQGFGGDVTGEKLKLSPLEGSGGLEVQLAGSSAAGSVLIGGIAHKFSARTAPDSAGYFFADGMVGNVAIQGRWVVAANGEQRGAVIDRLTSGVPSVAVTIEVKGSRKATVRINGSREEGRQIEVRQVVPKNDQRSDESTVEVDSLRTGYAY